MQGSFEGREDTASSLGKFYNWKFKKHSLYTIVIILRFCIWTIITLGYVDTIFDSKLSLANDFQTP